METFLYHLLQTKSRRAFLKTKKRNGRAYHYNPRSDLLESLSRETGLTIGQVYHQLQKERMETLRAIGRENP